MDDNEIYHFGFKNGQNYIDHNDIKKRDYYFKRHMANHTENELIINVIPSPALFSAILLWGPHKTSQENAKYLNDLFKMKEKDKYLKINIQHNNICI